MMALCIHHTKAGPIEQFQLLPDLSKCQEHMH